jgi:hypothetical protein
MGVMGVLWERNVRDDGRDKNGKNPLFIRV